MPKIEKFEPEVRQRDWGTETIVARTPTYVGKTLCMNPGTKGGLQLHRTKEETFYLWSGRAWVITDDGDGILKRIPMVAGESYHIPPGAVHQVEAVTHCIFFEASNPVDNDRVRLESQYGLPDTGGLPTT